MTSEYEQGVQKNLRIARELKAREELDIVPLGTILPFAPADKLPETWHKLDGSLLEVKENPELYERIWTTLDIWLKIGGNVSNTTIILPNIKTPEEAMELVFGYHSDPPMDIILAIKVNRGPCT